MSRIDNLGDYNEVRKDLQKYNGNKKKLYDDIGKIAVAKEKTKIEKERDKEWVMGIAIVLFVYEGIKKGFNKYKERKTEKKLLEREQCTKQRFEQLCDDALKETEEMSVDSIQSDDSFCYDICNVEEDEDGKVGDSFRKNEEYNKK